MSGGCDRERTDEEREIETLRSEVRTLRWEVRGARERADVAERTIAARTAERAALAATVEKLIREAGAVRLDERQRAKGDEDALVSRAHQRAIDRVAELEEQLAKARTLVDHADRVKDENEALRGQVRKLEARTP